MVLVVEGAPLVARPSSTEELYARYPSIVEKGLEFAGQKARCVRPEHCLYVAQGEFGVVPGDDPRVRIVGADDATTCHIVILRHPSGTVGVSHLDGSGSEGTAIGTMVERIAGVEGEAESLQLSVVGGYLPEEGSAEASKNEAERLSLKILGAFMRHERSFQLSLWCTCRLNTAQGSAGPRPAIYGAGVEVRTGSIFPASFEAHEPDLPLRSAYRWTSGQTRVHDLYDHLSGTISIQPFHHCDGERFSSYLQFADDMLLRNFSTSPKVEPPHFCQDLRNIIQLLVDHPNPQKTLFPDNKPKKYRMNSCGLWELVHG